MQLLHRLRQSINRQMSQMQTNTRTMPDELCARAFLNGKHDTRMEAHRNTIEIHLTISSCKKRIWPRIRFGPRKRPWNVFVTDCIIRLINGIIRLLHGMIRLIHCVMNLIHLQFIVKTYLSKACICQKTLSTTNHVFQHLDCLLKWRKHSLFAFLRARCPILTCIRNLL